MSLFRQIWLAVLASTLLAFAGSLVISMLTARAYLEEQLAIKNNDNASSLALSITQLQKDPVTIELQAAAIFDSGQYALVRISDPEGRVMIEKTADEDVSEAPEWFTRLFPIESRPGSALISSGWTQFGSVEIISHRQFAYDELWQGGQRLTLWFALGGLLVGALGMQLLRQIRRPLDAVVEQATALSERRFITVNEPKTPELRSVSRAMNEMVLRLKQLFAEEAARLEQVRREATQDPLTGLSNRAFFMNHLHSALTEEDAPPEGSLFLIRLADLAGINRDKGRECADDTLRHMGRTCLKISADHLGSSAARLNGADFALLLPGSSQAQNIAQELQEGLSSLISLGYADPDRCGHIAYAHYRHGEALSTLLARLDAALASASQESGLGMCAAPAPGSTENISQESWRQMLSGAIQAQRLRLVGFPVANVTGGMLHLECPLRLRATEDGDWLSAGSFMPMATRLAMTSDLDLEAIRMALDKIKEGQPAVAVNLSAESLLDVRFCQRLESLLQHNPAPAKQLWLEISEQGAFQHFAQFQRFCQRIQALGCRIGIEHFGRQFSLIGQLHDIGLDYLKVDGRFIRDIDRETGNQAFLKGLCTIAHNIGLTVIAESVQTDQELSVLPSLGFDGATGPAVK